MTTILSIAYIVIVTYVAVEYMTRKSGVNGDVARDFSE